MSDMPATSVTRLLADVSSGDKQAIQRLFPLVYDELHRLAARHFSRENDGHTLQATALVHEAYLRMAGKEGSGWNDRTHFFAVASQVMRHVLVDHARKRCAGKREGRARQTCLDDRVGIIASEESPEEMLALDAALAELERYDARLARVVEMRFFAGLSVEETAEAMGSSTATVKRDWRTARAWLLGHIGGGPA